MNSSGYTINKIDDSNAAWEHLDETFIEPCDYKLNWLFLSTDGVHGSPWTLEQLKEQQEEIEKNNDPYNPEITFLVVNPRMCRMYYGNIEVSTKEEEEWLRSVVKKTIDGVLMSQLGNLDRVGENITKLVINFVAPREDDFLGICNVPCCPNNAVEMVDFSVTKNKSEDVPVFLCQEHFDSFKEAM